MVAVAELSPPKASPSLSASTVAVFVRVPQLAAVVAPTMWTDAVAASAMSPKAQSSVPPAIEQFGLSGLSVQVTPAGSGSCNVTPVATPGPWFVTSIVNPAFCPALIVASSATLVTSTFGYSTIALGWMLRSWFLFPLLSRFWVRMCHGAPETRAAPLGPPVLFTQ